MAEAATRALLARCIQDTKVEKKVEEEDEEGEDLCNCEFSLAYGGKILLNNARLHLKRGRRYGLCGPNGAGKSTLMKAIANGQLEGFPPPDILKTVYVEHDIQGELADLSVLEYVFADPRLSGEPKEEVIRVLGSVGFTDNMQQAGVTSLSGGWKMKLALARAMLTRADIFLLDEVRYSAELMQPGGRLAPGVRVALPDACPAYAPLRSRDSPPTTWTSRTWPGLRTS